MAPCSPPVLWDGLALLGAGKAGGLMSERPELPADLQWLSAAARVGLLTLGSLLLAVVALQLLNGRISLHGMLHEKLPTGLGNLSPSRVQLLLATLIAACMLSLSLPEMIQAKELRLGSEVSVILFGGSNAIYLANKFLGFLKLRSLT